MSDVIETVEVASQMPVTNLIIIIVGIIILLVVLAYVIKKFGIRISKDSISARDYEYDQSCQTVMYHLQENIEQIDYETRRNIRRETLLCNYLISNLDSIGTMCPPARRSLFFALKEPFYEVINNNHFTRELMPGNYDLYRTSIFNALQDSYQNLLMEYGTDSCDKDNLPEWLQVEDDFYTIVDRWLEMAQGEVIKSCKRKINLYQKEYKSVENSKHWKQVLTDCITKNNYYIEVMNKRLEKKC